MADDPVIFEATDDEPEVRASDVALWAKHWLAWIAVRAGFPGGGLR